MSTELEDFSHYLKVEKGVSPNTLSAYRSDVRSLLGFFKKKEWEVSRARPDQLSEFLWERRSRNLKPATLYRLTEAVRCFFRFLAGAGRVREDPSLNLAAPRVQPRSPRSLTEEEMERLLNRLPRQDRGREVRFKAMLELMYAAGLKVSELVRLEEAQVDTDVGYVRVPGPHGTERLLPIHRRAAAAVKAWRLEKGKRRPEGCQHLFVNSRGRPLTRAAFWLQLKKWALAAGVPKALNPRMVRHSFAVHMLARGAGLGSLQSMLGHSDISTTQRYTHLDKERIKNLHKRYHPRG